MTWTGWYDPDAETSSRKRKILSPNHPTFNGRWPRPVLSWTAMMLMKSRYVYTEPELAKEIQSKMMELDFDRDVH
jgi:hypothetical protein